MEKCGGGGDENNNKEVVTMVAVFGLLASYLIRDGWGLVAI